MTEDPLLAWVERISAALAEEDVPHALAGGLAVAFRATPRATVDIDFVIDGDAASLERVRRAMAAAGLLQTRRPVVTMTKIRLLRMLAPPERSPDPIVVDLLIVTDFPVLARATLAPLGAQDVPVVSAEDLVLLKLARLSDQDLVDIRAVAAANDLDRPYLTMQAKKLGLTRALNKALPRRRQT